MNTLLVCKCMLVIVAGWFVCGSDSYSLFHSRLAEYQRTVDQDDIWQFMGITREEFKKEHRDLTPTTMEKIITEIKQLTTNLRNYLLYKEKVYKSEIIQRENGNDDLVDIGDIVEKDLNHLTKSLGISQGIHNADLYKQPEYVQNCLDEIDTNLDTNEKKYMFVSCAVLIFNKTEDTLNNKVFDDSLDSFINIFEDYIKSMTSFVQLFHGYTEETGTKYMKRNMDTKMLLKNLTRDLEALGQLVGSQ
ncbi:uncharacterized protein [Magallana gigas]|uniref:uncharacterized protein n=1 Tax=Magallana gigas TaxID=29159 RepID=UPI003340582F